MKLKDMQVPIIGVRGDFRFNVLSLLIVFVAVGIGAGLQLLLGAQATAEELAPVFGAAVGAAVLLFLLRYWVFVLIAIGGVSSAATVLLGTVPVWFLVPATAGFLIAPAVEIVKQWDKIVVLRLGKFHHVGGPGPLVILPIFDTIAGYVDTRIRVTDFSAEQSLTRDTVPVNIDALAFWMIWDAGRAILEVQQFEQAVILSAQTALRATIGANDLSTLLSERERLGSEIQHIVDTKTNPWGITILSVEFKEILVPKELEDALSKEAQADRERNARVILSSTEADIAPTFKAAAKAYQDDPVALQLRAMNMVYESMRTKGGLVLVPSEALKSMNLGTVLGAKAYSQDSGVDEG